jgi:AraC-like DNA-binding protein
VIKTISPSSPILKKYIECFYIFEGKANSSFSYVAFPHFNTGLSFFKGASIDRQNSIIKISENTDAGVHIEILGKYTTPVLLEYKGQLKNLTEITYEEGYYDQSYLIKEFRRITNHNPKDFFKSVSKVDGDKIIWEIK